MLERDEEGKPDLMIIRGIAKLKDEIGMTLVELLIVLAIITVLGVALGFNFEGWVGNYKVESQIKQIHVDLMNARVKAMATNRSHFVDFPTTTSYRTREDTNGDNDPSVVAGDTVLPTFPKTVDYTITGGVIITFDARGLIYQGAPQTLIAPDSPVTISLTSTMAPDYNCIQLSQTRINIGQMSGGNCAIK